MGSRSAAKKLSKTAKPARSGKAKAILAKGKPAKKPLAKVARFPKAKPKPKPKPQAPARAAAQKPAAPPPPPVTQRPLLGLPPPGFYAARAGSPARPPPARTPGGQPQSRPPPLPPLPQPQPHQPLPQSRAPLAQPARAPLSQPARAPLSQPARAPLSQSTRPPAFSQADTPLPGKTPMPPTPPKPGMPSPKKPLGMPQLRSAAVQTTLARQSLARSFYWSELRVGDDLPPLSKPAVDRVQIARYAAAANDYNRLHLDEPFAHALGFPGTFAPGALAMGFVGQLLTSWLRRGHVRRLSARFIKFVWPGDELTCRGRIAELRKDGGACYADIELWAENRKGELVLRGQATCELYEAPGSASTEGAGFLFSVDHGAGKGASGARPAQRPPSKPPPAARPPSVPPPKKK